jgi:hypothetical protein
VAEFTTYRPGMPSWVDLATTDVRAAQAFYGGLFGWDVVVGGHEAGGYCMFQKQARNVAGLARVMQDEQSPAWTTYVSVSDADATVAVIERAGGTIVMGVTDVLDAGRMALFADPTGAPCALWQPAAHIGAQLANEPGTVCWNELQTRDTALATAFYRDAFGWAADVHTDSAVPYTEWKLEGDSVGGMMDMPAEVPPQIPPYWLVYFGVDDCDGAVGEAAALGGVTLVAPMDIVPGRLAVLSDPSGAVFAVIAMTRTG